MDAEKEHGVVGFEAVLGAIAVVDIPVDDGHPGDSALALQITGGYRDIVEKTKPHDLIEFGVVARRPAATEGIFGARGEYCIDCRQRGTGGEQGCAIGTWRAIGVGRYLHGSVDRR